MIPVMRGTTGTMLVLAVTAVILSGCGNSTSASSSSTALDPGTPLANAQVLAYAHAVNLRAADLPGTTSKRYVEVVKYQRKHGSFPGCSHLPTGELLMKVQSPIFGSAYWWARSTVGAMSSETFAAAYASALGNPRDRHCLLPPHAELKVAFSALPVASPSFGLRVTEDAGTFDQSHRDIFAFASGRAVVTLTISGSRTPSLRTDQRLLFLLNNRAKAHKLG
jgi:hypothetical protein